MCVCVWCVCVCVCVSVCVFVGGIEWRWSEHFEDMGFWAVWIEKPRHFFATSLRLPRQHRPLALESSVLQASGSRCLINSFTLGFLIQCNGPGFSMPIPILGTI